MNRRRLKERALSRLDTIQFYIFHGLVLLTPLALFRWSYDQFDLPKLVLLRVLTLLLLLLWSVKILFSDQVGIRRSKLDLPILLFLTLAALSALFSIHLPTALFGKYKRYEGFLTLLTYAILYFLAVQSFSDFSRLRSLTKTTVVAAAIVSYYGLMQYLGYDFLRWTQVPFEVNRSFSTLGNPSLLAGYLVIMFFVGLGVYFSASRPIEGLLFGVFTFLIFTCLLTTFNRGGWLSCLVGLLLVVVLIGGRLWRYRRGQLLALVISLLLVTLLVGLFSARSFNPATNLLRRAQSVARAEEGSLRSRIEIWRSALGMIKDRPLFGYGPDCFRLAFPQYQTLRYTMGSPRTIADNAHNYPLQLASMLGLPAAIAFLFIVVLFFKSGLGLLSSTPPTVGRVFLNVGLLVGVFGYLGYLLLGVSVIGSTTFLWLLMGLIVAQGDLKEVVFSWGPVSLWFRGIVFTVATIAILWCSVLSTYPLIADFHFTRARSTAGVGPDFVVREYEKAIRFFPYIDRYPCDLGNFYLRWSRTTGERAPFDGAVKSFEIAKRISPYEVDNYIFLADAYMYGASCFDSAYLVKAIGELKLALELKPYSPPAHYLLGACYLDRGELKLACEHLLWVVRVSPDYAPAHLLLGRCYERMGDDDKALEAYRRALELNPDSLEAKESVERLKS
ncbi:MAG: O-antigen ligase family protein [Actinomycetota bacterium]|nr:O-antigen ligase family protein [Actinomycetota bacterium]